jgi:hypothetical protein
MPINFKGWKLLHLWLKDVSTDLVKARNSCNLLLTPLSPHRAQVPHTTKTPSHDPLPCLISGTDLSLNLKAD